MERQAGLTGRSSGGYGSLRLAMEYPDRVQTIACHAGEWGLKQVLLVNCPLPLHKAGSPLDFLKEFWTKSRFCVLQRLTCCVCRLHIPNMDVAEGSFPQIYP